MSIDRHISANQVVGFILLLLGLALAIYAGSLVGTGDWGMLATIFVGCFGGMIYFGVLSPYWIWLALAWGVFGFGVRPAGPLLTELHITIALAIVFVGAFAWRKTPNSASVNTIQRFFRPFQIALICYLTYMAGNAVLTKYFPNEPLPVAWGNLAKQNLEMWGGFLIVAIALKWPSFCRLPKNFGNWLTFILILSLVVNIVIRAYASMVLGLGQAQELGSAPMERGRTAIYVPGINLMDSPYTLRATAPFCALLGVALLTTEPGTSLMTVSRLLSTSLVAVSLLAAAFAGGRATVILAFLLPSLFLFIRKRYTALIMVATSGLLLLIGIRFVYDINYKLVPFMVQRSIAMIPGMQMEEARESIAGSSDWRYDLAMRAMNEWTSNARTIMLGRGVYAFTGEDVTAILLNASEGTLESSLLRGHTHNAVLDHLVVTGLVGIVLYHIVLFTLLSGVYQILRRRPHFDVISALCLVSITQTVVLFLVGFLGSGFFWTITALITSSAIVLASREALMSDSIVKNQTMKERKKVQSSDMPVAAAI